MRRLRLLILTALLAGGACSWAPESAPPVPVTVPPPATDATGLRWPLAFVDISSGFGHPRPAHRGVDLREPKGTTILAAGDGTVAFAGEQRGYGNVIILAHRGGLRTLYAHNHRNLVSAGQSVRRGEAIATVGRTGNATGYHVHFEVMRGNQRLDPVRYIDTPAQD